MRGGGVGRRGGGGRRDARPGTAGSRRRNAGVRQSGVATRTLASLSTASTHRTRSPVVHSTVSRIRRLLCLRPRGERERGVLARRKEGRGGKGGDSRRPIGGEGTRRLGVTGTLYFAMHGKNEVERDVWGCMGLGHGTGEGWSKFSAQGNRCDGCRLSQ